MVKDLSRFGRNAIETGYYIETIFPCLNVRLIAINDDFDSSREEDRNSMIVPIKNMINEMYAKDASKKRVLAFEMQSRQGNVKIGRSIYGYSVDKENNQLVINPETAPVVRMIFRWYLMGVKTGDIAKRLEMLGVTTPNSYKAAHEAETKIPETDLYDRVLIKYHKALYSYKVGNPHARNDIEQCLSTFEYLDSFGVAQKLKEQFERIQLTVVADLQIE